MESIVEGFLRNDIDFQLKAFCKKHTEDKEKENLISFYDDHFYFKHNWKTHNKNKIILYKPGPPIQEEKIEEKLKEKLKSCKEMSLLNKKFLNFLSIPNVLQEKHDNFNEFNQRIRRSLFEKENSRNSIEINSFFENESTLNPDMIGTSSFLSLKTLKRQTPKTGKNFKGLKLLKNEYSSDYKPKILTTNKCFLIY